MGRLTDAMRRAADVASRRQADDELVQAVSDPMGATDDLFPIELENGNGHLPWSDEGAAAGAEPAGSAVIMPAGEVLPQASVEAPAAENRHAYPPSSAPVDAAAPADAERVFNQLVERCRREHAGRVETGRFGAHMVVSLVNDGPVTFLLRA